MSEPPPVIVRYARAEDITLFPDIERSAAHAFRATPHSWVADDDDTPLDAYLPLLVAGTLLVAEMEGTVVGFVSAHAEPDALHILELAVALALQRRGIGRLLMEAAIELARLRGLPAVTLTTFRDVAFNAPFYSKLGFAPVKRPPPRLKAILLAEQKRGLEQRCAMRLILDGRHRAL